MKKSIVFAFAAAGLCGVLFAKPSLIIDTDVGSSTDDLFAIELAAKYHRDGLVDFTAVMIDRPGADNLEFTKRYLHYHNLDQVAIGTIDGKTEGQLIFVPYVELIRRTGTLEKDEGPNGKPIFEPAPANRAGRVENAVTLYRRLLAAAPDASVDICAIGFFTNLKALLDTKGDEISSLDGNALVAKKVRKLRIMAGSFDHSLDHPEYNVWGDVPGAKRILDSWPTPIVVTPYETGVKIYLPRNEVVADYPASHPLGMCYRLWDPDGPRSKSQLMWDPMTVMGVKNEADGFTIFSDSQAGKVTVDDKGFTTFTPGAEGGRTTLQLISLSPVNHALQIRADMRALGCGNLRAPECEVSPLRVVAVCAAPAKGGEEFVALENVSAAKLDLGGMRLVGSQPEESVAVSAVIPAGTTLGAHERKLFRQSELWPGKELPNKALNVLVYSVEGDVLCEAFVDSRWFGGAAQGTGRHFEVRNEAGMQPPALAVEQRNWKLAGGKQRLTVLDCDPGTDDSSAIFALSREGRFPDVCVATYGNMPEPVVAKNLLLLNRYLDEKAELYHGAMRPYTGKEPSCGDFHGADGFGGVQAKLAGRFQVCDVSLKELRPFEKLAERLLQAEDVTYIAVGPLASLARTIESEPRVKDHIKRVFIMGGGIHTFNMPHETEYNFFGDPVAVKKVLTSGLDITLFPLDITSTDAVLTTADIDQLEKFGVYPEIISMMRCNLKSNVKTEQAKGAILHDVLPCLYSIHPELFQVKEMRLAIDQYGHLSETADGIRVKIATSLQGGLVPFFRQAFSRR